MFKNLVVAGAVSIATIPLLPFVAHASDWGCEVHLCLSGDWKATPSCHPPIQKLISEMKRPGFSWPTCPQANSSAASYQPFEKCVTGFEADSDLLIKFQDNKISKLQCYANVPETKILSDVPSLNIKNGSIIGSLGKSIPVTATLINGGKEDNRPQSVLYTYPREVKEKP